MPWPSAQVAVGDVIQASQLNLLPIQIADSTLLAGASSFDFTSLPGQFAHLLVEVYGRGDNASTSVTVQLRLNNDVGANYDWQQITGGLTTAGAAQGLAATAISVGNIPAASATASVFSGHAFQVSQYAGTTGQKSVAGFGGLKQGTTSGDLLTYTVSGYWRSAAAITRVTLLLSAGNFVAGSRATIYGLA